jgi:hypothetical protein
VLQNLSNPWGRCRGYLAHLAHISNNLLVWNEPVFLLNIVSKPVCQRKQSAHFSN